MVLGHNTMKTRQRTQDVKISQDVTFETMLLNSNTLCGLRDSGFFKPSPIQLHGIPLGKCGFDLLLEAKSGTGKTAVFTIITLEKICLENGLQAIILAPTREIAAQICDVIKQIGSKYTGLAVEVVMGGLPVKEDIAKFRKNVHIVVGSPGRLKHLIQDKHIDTTGVRLLVLDEADKLMEKSFLPDIDYIICSLPQQKQIILSSATFPDDSKPFINQYVQIPQHICPDSNSILLGIAQTVTIVKHNSNIVRQTQNRFDELLKILTKREFKQCLIFCNYQARVTDLYKLLKKAKWPAEKLYGQQEQIDRLDALKTLQEYKCRILIATDLAARGIDSSHVDLVVNFEPPSEWQTYLHRIGRAGRFGTYGLAVSILTKIEERQFKDLLKSMQLPLEVKDFWSDETFQHANIESITPTVEDSILCESKKHNDTYKDIWIALSQEKYKNVETEVDTFNNLCLSFHKMDSDSKVEEFSDLLNSFENSQEQFIESSSQYQCFKGEPITIREYLNSIRNIVYNDEKQFSINKISSSSSLDSLKEKDLIDHIERTQYLEDENCNYKIHKKLNINQNKCKGTKNIKHQPIKVIQRTSDNHGCNAPSLKLDHKKPQFNTIQQYCSSEHLHGHFKKEAYVVQSDRKHHLSQEYVNWYNLLKFRTKQIEMAVYINEMSNI